MSSAPITAHDRIAPQDALRAEGLDGREWRRRLWHMAPGLLPFALWPFSHADPISPTLRLIVLGVVAAIGVGVFIGYRRIARSGDTGRLTSVLGYTGSIAATVLVFPHHAELGLAVLAVLAFGDGSATLLGRLLGGPRLPWNREKSFAGLLAFVTFGVPLSALVYWGETHFNLEALPPYPSFGIALLCVIPAVTAAALAESVRSSINDNIRVGATAAAGLAIMHGWLVGL